MNKKVLTLCAGLLLSGSVFAAHQAGVDWSNTLGALDNAGKYWQLNYLNYRAGAGDWTTGGTGYYLTLTDGANPQLVIATAASGLLDESSYWTLKVIPLTAGETYPDAYCVALVEVVNEDGYTLTLNKTTHELADDNTAEADKVSRFYVRKGTNDNLTLAYYPTGNNSDVYCIGQDVSINATTVKIKGKQLGTDNYGVSWNIVNIAEEALPAKELNAQLNGGFELNFSSKGEAYKNLTWAEAFGGKLTAVGVNVDDEDEIATSGDKKYYFRTSDGRYIVLDDEYLGTNTSTLKGNDEAIYRGYNFKTISEHAFKNLTDKSNATFTVFRTYDFNDKDSLIISLPNVKNIGAINAGGLNASAPNNESGLRMFVSSVLGSDVLTTVAYTHANDKLATPKADDYNTAQLGAWAPYIKFGASNIVDWSKFAGKVWNITDEKGNVLSPKADGDIDYSTSEDYDYAQLFAPAEEVDKTNPEGQWLLDDAGNCFVNRESGEQAFKSTNNWTIRSLGGDKYALYNSRFDTEDEYTIYITEAKDAELGWTENGYVIYDMDEEQNNGKYLSFETTFGTAYVGKDADDNVILTQDVNEAIEFRVKQMSHDFEDHDGIAAPDTLQHYTSFMNVDKDGELYVDVDTLQFFHYALYENFSEKYLMYNTKTKKFQLSDESYTGNGHENFDQEGAKYAFVVKAREDGSYILVRDYAIDYDECLNDATHDHEIQKNWNNENATFDNVFEVNFGKDAYTLYDEDGNIDEKDRSYKANGQAHKLYAGTQKDGFLTDMADIYNYNDNDRITIEATNKVEYMKFNAGLDTVKISLQRQPNFFLYEHNVNGTNFLSMEHVADVEDMKAAIFVDTAYVRGGTDRPQYLLAVGANHVDAEWDNHDDSPEIPVHMIHPDTTYGRFLVNMVDSAKAWKASVKTNPYIHEELNGNYYYRLAFIDGLHYNDKLYLNNEDETVIDLSNNNEKVCTFSFRYVDEEREGVKIETTYDGKTRGWLKYQNNVPVVTNDYEDAHVFLVDNTTTEAPTANETIAAEGAISVVATDGAVIIKGAEGKNVVIATILGKVVANETINSDNETIAVPAGIAVVSVDGESFKVVVK